MPASEGNEPRTCGICGRSILRGEGVVDYVSPEGELTPVCALCRDRVQALGWVRSDSRGSAPWPPVRRRRWLGGLRDRLQASRQTEPQDDAPEVPESPADLAIERFNRSDAARMVAGLSKSLGAPRVSVRGRDDGAEVVVAWDLSWYRWEVGLNGEEEPRRVGKGAEVSELDGEDLEWNAAVDEEGRLRWLDG